MNVRQRNVTSRAGVTPGSISDDPWATTACPPNASLPVKRLSTSAAAALNVLCPDTYSPNGGVGNVGGWYGTHSAPSTVRPPHVGMVCPWYRKRIAVIGRAESRSRLTSHEAMPASMTELASAKNSLASWSSPCRSRAEICWANRHQWPGGVSLLGPSDQYSEIAFCLSSSAAVPETISAACARNPAEPYACGAGTWSARSFAAPLKEATPPQCGARNGGVTTAPARLTYVSGAHRPGAFSVVSGSATTTGALTGA